MAFCLCSTTNYDTYIYKQKGYKYMNYLDELGVAKEEEKAQEMFRILREILQNRNRRIRRERKLKNHHLLQFS